MEEGDINDGRNEGKRERQGRITEKEKNNEKRVKT